MQTVHHGRSETAEYFDHTPSTPIGFWGFNPVNGVGIRGSYHYMIRPTLLHHFAAGYTGSNPIRQQDTRKGNEIYKLPGVSSDAPGFPVFNINNTYGSLALGNSN